MIEGIITQGRGGFYTVRTNEGTEHVLRAKKKLRHLKLTPLVGDKIMFSLGETEQEQGWVEEILPRLNVCLRPPVANVSLMAIVISPEPQPDFLLIDKLLIYANIQKMRVAIIVNKSDIDQTLYTNIKAQYQKAQVTVHQTSALHTLGVEQLRPYLQGETVCFLGQSGVGKSTLLNALLGTEVETGEISKKILRGKNTTRHSQLFVKQGIRVLDTPGFSLLELQEGLEPVTLQQYYPEFTKYEGQCRFQPCYHLKEPDCAVLNAVQEGEISQERITRYHQLLNECKMAWRERYD